MSQMNFQGGGQAGEQFMLTGWDNGQPRWTVAPHRSIVMRDQNTNLVDFSAEVVRDGAAPGSRASNRRPSSWSDDGQEPSARESAAVAGGDSMP